MRTPVTTHCWGQDLISMLWYSFVWAYGYLCLGFKGLSWHPIGCGLFWALGIRMKLIIFEYARVLERHPNIYRAIWISPLKWHGIWIQCMVFEYPMELFVSYIRWLPTYSNMPSHIRISPIIFGWASLWSTSQATSSSKPTSSRWWRPFIRSCHMFTSIFPYLLLYNRVIVERRGNIFRVFSREKEEEEKTWEEERE